MVGKPIFLATGGLCSARRESHTDPWTFPSWTILCFSGPFRTIFIDVCAFLASGVATYFGSGPKSVVLRNGNGNRGCCCSAQGSRNRSWCGCCSGRSALGRRPFGAGRSGLATGAVAVGPGLRAPVDGPWWPIRRSAHSVPGPATKRRALCPTNLSAGFRNATHWVVIRNSLGRTAAASVADVGSRAPGRGLEAQRQRMRLLMEQIWGRGGGVGGSASERDLGSAVRLWVQATKCLAGLRFLGSLESSLLGFPRTLISSALARPLAGGLVADRLHRVPLGLWAPLCASPLTLLEPARPTLLLIAASSRLLHLLASSARLAPTLVRHNTLRVSGHTCTSRFRQFPSVFVRKNTCHAIPPALGLRASLEPQAKSSQGVPAHNRCSKG